MNNVPFYNIATHLIVYFLPCDAALQERDYVTVCRLSVRQSVCLSISPSVTFRYYDHIGWNTSKIISRLNSLHSAVK